ncbi:hypothetical protein WN51_07902 [Melipona quadrifasciata]|uniref:Uncharacterized protein n=1 Tax=Melipona quadrifasciata TaxID=166423 RepID=A0A0M9A6X6_9HYME|nr:hypothetical protein WN51_07902 [Melipona quadrifasciata]
MQRNGYHAVSLSAFQKNQNTQVSVSVEYVSKRTVAIFREKANAYHQEIDCVICN